MRHTNRVEPLNTDAGNSTRVVMITTTQLEIIRRVEVTPIEKESTGHLRSLTGVTRSIKPSRKILWCVACLFLTTGILALAIMITGLTIILGRMKAMRKSNIERYDLGDLHYGINNDKYPANTYLSNINKEFIQKYLSDQLVTEPGFLGLVIDGVFVQEKVDPPQRKQRDTSCSMLFIIQNIQVYFDHCSTCINERNLLLRRLFFNRTTFEQPFYLLLNSRHIFTQICSTPNTSRLILPKRLNISYVDKLNTNLQSSSSTLSPSKTNSEIETAKSTDIGTVVATTYDSRSTTDLIEMTSNDMKELISFTTDHLSTITKLDPSQTHQTSSYTEDTTPSLTYTSTSTKLTTSHTTTSHRKTTSNIFEFLPFRPSTTTFPWRSIKEPYNNSLTVIKTNTTRQ